MNCIELSQSIVLKWWVLVGPLTISFSGVPIDVYAMKWIVRESPPECLV